jgi:hypothetical protein
LPITGFLRRSRPILLPVCGIDWLDEDEELSSVSSETHGKCNLTKQSRVADLLKRL